MRANLLEFNGVVFSMVGDVSVNSETSVVTSSNLNILGVGFAYLCSHGGESECLSSSISNEYIGVGFGYLF